MGAGTRPLSSPPPPATDRRASQIRRTRLQEDPRLRVPGYQRYQGLARPTQGVRGATDEGTPGRQHWEAEDIGRPCRPKEEGVRAQAALVRPGSEDSSLSRASAPSGRNLRRVSARK